MIAPAFEAALDNTRDLINDDEPPLALLIIVVQREADDGDMDMTIKIVGDIRAASQAATQAAEVVKEQLPSMARAERRGRPQ